MMQTVMDDTDPFGMPSEVPMCESVEEILKQLEPAFEGKSVAYFRFPPLKLVDYPRLAEAVNQLVAERPQDVELFPLDGAFSMGDQLLMAREGRETIRLHAMAIDTAM